MGSDQRICINYADRKFYASQARNSASALEVGEFTGVYEFGRADLDAEFVAENRDILELERGAGYWLWKPYIISRCLAELEDGDFLFYSDSGSSFISSITPYCETMTGDVLVFELTHPEYKWTKRDCFVLMDCDSEIYTQTNQRLATFLLLKKSADSVAFVQEYLDCCLDGRLLLDAENVCGEPDYPDFCEHRHDQSILSLLSKKAGVQCVPDPSQWGNGLREGSLPQLVDHHRDGN